MLKPMIYTLIAVACIFTMPGCPPKSPGTPAGTWRMTSNLSCGGAGAFTRLEGLVLRSNGTATHYDGALYNKVYFDGTWTISGTTLRIYTTDESALEDVVFIGTFQKNKIVNGRATADGVGRSDCWTAERVVF